MQDSPTVICLHKPNVSSVLHFLEESDSGCLPFYSEKIGFAEYVRELMEHEEISAVVDDDGAIVSMAAGYLSEAVGDYAYLSVLATHRKNRGCGLANAALADFVRRAEDAGFLGVHLHVNTGNRDVIRACESLGFSQERFVVEERPDDLHYLKLIRRTVLITAIGSFSAARVISDLREAGYRIIGCDIYPGEWIANSRDVDAFYQVPRASDCEGYISALESIVASEDVGYVIPSTDYEIDVLADCERIAGARLCASPAEALKRCRNKVASSATASKIVPNMLIPTFPLDAIDPQGFSYPAVCKPVGGRSSEGMEVVEDPESLFSLAARVGGGYCIQPFVRGGIVTVDVVRQPGCETAVVARRELLRTPNGAGTTVEVFPADGGLSSACERLAEALGVIGCVNFEFIEEAPGKYRFLECNPRFSGGVAFSCMAGYGCIANHMRAHQGLAIDAVGELEYGIIARRYSEYPMST